VREDVCLFDLKGFVGPVIRRLVTRIYFEDGEGNDEDPVLALAPAGRRGTLIARSAGPAAYRFDIHLQGANETVFFDV